MKIICIGDIHGRDVWRKIPDLEAMLEHKDLIPTYDKYIFMGDYVDSFKIKPIDILDNLKSLIQLKENYPNHIILLLANHDNQYILGYEACGCSGFKGAMSYDYHDLYTKNIDKFTPIHVINNYIFSHAGISNAWIHRFNSYYELLNGVVDIEKIKDAYNDPTINPLFDVGYRRGGDYANGGIFWADFEETRENFIPNYHQVVGHTPMKEITRFENIEQNSSITYVDVLKDDKEPITYSIII